VDHAGDFVLDPCSSGLGRNPAVFAITDTSRQGHTCRMAGLPSGRLVVLLAFPGVQALDLVGPMEVFTGASSIAAGAYEVQVAAPGPGGLGLPAA